MNNIQLIINAMRQEIAKLKEKREKSSGDIKRIKALTKSLKNLCDIMEVINN